MKGITLITSLTLQRVNQLHFKIIQGQQKMVASESESMDQDDQVWEYLNNFCDLLTDKEFMKGALVPFLIVFKLVVILIAKGCFDGDENTSCLKISFYGFYG